LATARAHPEFLAALDNKRLRAVVICPSNPFISVDPILALPNVRAALAACRAPIVAVSPIIGGKAVKGPTAKIMGEFGLTPSAAEVARHYGDLLDGFVIDHADAADTAGLDVRTKVAQTLMRTLADREALARVVLDFADAIRHA
jgi:LPPG:FO 2-phospho-L-lactate transferase